MPFAGQLPKNVRIREVGPRDGFQNEPEIIATRDKIALIDRPTVCSALSTRTPSGTHLLGLLGGRAPPDRERARGPSP